jgi:hypothetical protein
MALLALLALAAFEAVSPLVAMARELPATLAAGRRVLELLDRAPAVVDPAAPVAPPAGLVTVALEGACARYAPGSGGRSTAWTCGWRPGAAWRSSVPAAPARPPSRTSCCASSIPRRAG